MTAIEQKTIFFALSIIAISILSLAQNAATGQVQNWRYMNMHRDFLTESEARAFLAGQTWGRLATVGPDGPYITPLHYVLNDDKIYFHSSTEGKKLDNLAADSRVCFEVSTLIDILEHHTPCKFSTRFISVQVFGKAYLVKETEEKLAVLNLLAQRFMKSEFVPVDAAQASKVSVIALHIERISGRESKD
ncbi:pyridoxamine 5'-phosphate oxidase family protein [Desulfotruncus alcoholivorax]|uniref:pyridoxamine 5'-phosphate oxidase family protein n=1 Tax=Desulfotruncus alcoholivorax TaxID=265477 RepID=UPI000401BE11|nr:pyridoxamine 5'-phosphate oxidase family protein [Desulfotruncus alcoholivorax]